MRRRVLRWLIGGIVLVALGALCHVSIHLRAIQLAYELAQETRTLETLEETSRKLRAETAFLKSPERIEKIARQQLGMVSLDPRAMRVVRAPKKTREATQ